MFNVSDKAQAEIAAYFADKELKPLRVFLHPGGCAGPELLMAIDEKKDGDETFKVNGIDFLIEKKLLEDVSPVEIDYIETGFTIKSSLKVHGGCSGCCGSCGS
ncbi:MAG: IscA/HesB family protein [Desulfobacteraceae bacterium]|nr:IscA/HesB family protein [Desulfobacteraceae bacterium]MCB9494317.1 IscA/HesB family protein [Desulfobacteraceae bacterium]